MELTKWISYGSTRQILAGVGDPFGRTDTANQSAREWWDHFTAEHNEDGSHKVGGLSIVEEDSYTSVIGDQIVVLAESTLVIDTIMIVGDLTQYPVIASVDMTADDTKEFGTNAFQANMIKDISIPGQFTVGQDDAVNAQGSTETYHYLVVGHEV